jgi:hypothetical protein
VELSNLAKALPKGQFCPFNDHEIDIRPGLNVARRKRPKDDHLVGITVLGEETQIASQLALQETFALSSSQRAI